MNKNGTFFYSLIGQRQVVASLWDPYAYRHQGDVARLSDYASIKRAGQKSAVPSLFCDLCPFLPIEYKDVPGGSYLSFALTPARGVALQTSASVGEEELLFGTMRAYLGNIIVTPRAEWIGLQPPLSFPVKSEFVSILPHDRLPYFWLVYLRSRTFLEHLPLGGGGTRPRLQAPILENVPVSVPDVDTRKAIHDQVEEMAAQEWRNYFNVARTVNAFLEKL